MGTQPMMLTAAAVADAMHGRLVTGAGDRLLDGFAIDSRTLASGDLFFAIVAQRDGHEFAADALSRGAAGVVVRRGAPAADAIVRAATGEQVVIEVADTERALQDLARHVRRSSSATVVAITGSAGKTTTKETIAELLSSRYRVVKNRGNLNNHLGLPLSLLELRRGADVAVMELGMNHSGEIRVLVNIAEPQIRVWTNVGDAHLGHFGSREEIADAKGEILEAASATDLLVCNVDDPLVMSRAPRFAGRTVTFGTAESANVRAESIEELGLAGSRVHVTTPKGAVDVHVPLLGLGNLSNVLAAIAVAIEMAVPLADIPARAANLQPAPHRGAVVRLVNGPIIVDDSYNSSPTALQRALEVIARDRGAARKAAVLGEMLELGEHSHTMHAECGRAAASAKLDRLITVGGEPAGVMAEAAVRAGLPNDVVTWAPDSGAAADLILSWLSPGDLVLVKGSRGIKTDAVVDRITAEYA